MYFISIRIFTKKTEVRGELGISMHLITYDIMMSLIIFQVLTRIRISAIPGAQYNKDVALNSQKNRTFLCQSSPLPSLVV